MAWTFREIEHAAKVLRLPEKATLKQIKEKYKKLMSKWHPDTCDEVPEKCKKMAQRINEAYAVITEYCHNYQYSFKKEEIRRDKSHEEFWAEHFAEDPIWGRPNKKK